MTRKRLTIRGFLFRLVGGKKRWISKKDLGLGGYATAYGKRVARVKMRSPKRNWGGRRRVSR